MRGYISTRGAAKCVNFVSVLLSGYANDGGMFLPEVNDLPKLNWREWNDKSYPDIVRLILKQFITPEDIPHKDLDGEWQ